MERFKNEHIGEVQLSFNQGFKLGKLIPSSEYRILQEQFATKALEKGTIHHLEYRSIALGFDTALLDRGLIKTKKAIQNIDEDIKMALKKFKEIETKSLNRSDDLSLSR